MLCLLLIPLIKSEKQTLNLTKYARGSWNATTHVLNDRGEIRSKEDVLYIDFGTAENNTYIGRLRGYHGDFEVMVQLDAENPQLLSLWKLRTDEDPELLCKTEIKYGKRNLPHARGQWKGSTEHFKIVILSSHHFELTIYKEDKKQVEVYRFEKTPIFQEPSIASAILPPIVIGGIIIVQRLYDMHKFICEREKREAEAAERRKQAKEKKLKEPAPEETTEE